jgi:hypothetical protein
MKEELQFIAYLATCHTEDLSLGDCLLDIRDLQWNSLFQLLGQGYSLWKLHPQALETVRIQIRDLGKLKVSRSSSSHTEST